MHYIMNKNTPVLEIETGKILNAQMCPYSLKIRELSFNKIYKWLMHRALPLSRKNADKIYKTVNLHRDNAELQLMYLTHGLSINDNFWIANEKEIGVLKYEDISLFRNSLSKEMYLVALRGDDAFTISEGEISAEYTGQGTFPKCFVREKDGLYLYKSGTPIEIQNEIYAGYIAEVLRAKTVHYDYFTLSDIGCTKSKIVTNENIHWESTFIMSEFMNDNGYTPQSYMQAFNNTDYSDMIILDAIILNDDRHMKNWSLEFDSNSNMLIGLAPNYDYNNAFRADSKTYSTLIFDEDGRKVNILKAARIAYQKYGTTLQLNLLYDNLDYLTLPINRESMKRRIEYIVGNKDTQKDCY